MYLFILLKNLDVYVMQVDMVAKVNKLLLTRQNLGEIDVILRHLFNNSNLEKYLA